MLLLVALGELLGMTLWFSATAAAPAIAAEPGARLRRRRPVRRSLGGEARVAGLAMIASATAATTVVYGRPLSPLLLLAAVWGFSVVADSAPATSLAAR